MTRTARRIPIVVVAGTLLLAGCFSEHVAGPDGEPCEGTGVEPCLVTITDNAFAPATLRVTDGSTVRWVYPAGASAHTVTADDGSFDSGTMTPGSGFDTQFDAPGDYEYECVFHPGMTGLVRVE